MIRWNDTPRAAQHPTRVTPPLPELGDVRTTDTVTRRLRLGAAARMQSAPIGPNEAQLMLMGFIAGATFGVVITAGVGLALSVLL